MAVLHTRRNQMRRLFTEIKLTDTAKEMQPKCMQNTHARTRTHTSKMGAETFFYASYRQQFNIFVRTHHLPSEPSLTAKLQFWRRKKKKKKEIKDFPLNSSVAGCGRDKLGHPVKLEECFTFRIVSQLLILQTVFGL